MHGKRTTSDIKSQKGNLLTKSKYKNETVPTRG